MKAKKSKLHDANWVPCGESRSPSRLWASRPRSRRFPRPRSNTRLVVALGVSAAFETQPAAASATRRRAFVASLALRCEAYLIAEVRRYGEKLTAAATRRAFARSIVSVLRAATERAGVDLTGRVVSEAPALVGLARALVEPGNRVDPTAMAACKQLLTDGRTSALLNPALEPTELEAVLRRIHDGIHRRPATGTMMPTTGEVAVSSRRRT